MICYLRKNGRAIIAVIPRRIADDLYYSNKIDEWQRIYISKRRLFSETDKRKKAKKTLLHSLQRQSRRGIVGSITREGKG